MKTERDQVIELHQFTCVNEHEFYVDMKLPKALHEFIKEAESMTCPKCQSTDLLICQQPVKVVPE